MTTVPLSRMRKAVVRTVIASAAMPQFSLAQDIPAEVPRRAKDRARQHHPKASVSDVINAAVAQALVAHPNVNAMFGDNEIVQHDEVNVAFIVEVSDGMVTPVIRNAADLSMAELADERIRLTAGALTGRLTPEEMMTGTFTVSNLGPLGIHRFTAMVLPGQAAVLAVGGVNPQGFITFTVSCDHRVIDGAPAARFLNTLVEKITEAA